MNNRSFSRTIAPKAYSPVAIYFEEADSLEYVRQDVPCVYRRIDELLTLILAMDTRDPMGFSLKGFRNFYLKHFEIVSDDKKKFVSIVGFLEKALSEIGNEIFLQNERKSAYEKAMDIASEDSVTLREFPKVA